MIKFKLNKVSALNIIIGFAIFLAIFIRWVPMIEDMMFADSELKNQQGKFLKISDFPRSIKNNDCAVFALSQQQLTQLPDIMEGFSRKYGLELVHWESLSNLPQPVSPYPLLLTRFRISLELEDVQGFSRFLVEIRKKLPAILITSYNVDSVKKIAKIEINALISTQKVKRVFTS